MTRARRILMVSSEVASLARTGGLGDVVEALSRTLAVYGADVLVVTPKYAVTRAPAGAWWWKNPVIAQLGFGHERRLGVLEAQWGPPDGPTIRACMLADSALFDRNGIYGDRTGPFGDNAFRFATLSRGALSVAAQAWDGALPDVVHAHDWHAALSVIYARKTCGAAWARVPTVFTIHNLAFQGVVDRKELGHLAIPADAWQHGYVRHDGQVNLLKGAIELADRVTTVSETYAREIQTLPHGHGLDAHLRWHARKLVGIVNGIDTQSFDPRSDEAIVQQYGDADAREGKRSCKRALAAELGLDTESTAPLFSVVSRLQWLKGIDIWLEILPAIIDRGARVALVGTGDLALENALREAAARWPGKVAARVTFDPMLARRVFAGSDFLVVPSRDEPCGLTQMYAMRYGAVPIVTAVGGLLDTVAPLDVAHGAGTGIVAPAPDAVSLLLAIEEAFGVWANPIAMAALVGRAMARDSSWSASAGRYISMYEDLTGT